MRHLDGTVPHQSVYRDFLGDVGDFQNRLDIDVWGPTRNWLQAYNNFIRETDPVVAQSAVVLDVAIEELFNLREWVHKIEATNTQFVSVTGYEANFMWMEFNNITLGERKQARDFLIAQHPR